MPFAQRNIYNEIVELDHTENLNVNRKNDMANSTVHVLSLKARLEFDCIEEN